ATCGGTVSASTSTAWENSLRVLRIVRGVSTLNDCYDLGSGTRVRGVGGVLSGPPAVGLPESVLGCGLAGIDSRLLPFTFQCERTGQPAREKDGSSQLF